MDFYSYKLHTYSKTKTDLPLSERMYMAKFHAEEQAQAEYDRIKQSYIQSLSTNPAPGLGGLASAGRMAGVVYQELLIEASKKVATIQSQSVDEFFKELSREETFAIEDYSDKKLAVYSETVQNLSNLKNNKGISAKLTNIFGQGDKTRETLVGQADLLSQQYTVAQDSLTGWSYMQEDERLEYLVGRIEVDHLTSFDEKGINNFGKVLSVLSKENSNDQTISIETISQNLEE